MKRKPTNSVFCDRRYALLSEDLERARNDLDSAYRNLSCVTEPDLIDCYIYELQSIQMRYKFLLNRMKELEDSNMCSSSIANE